MERFVLDRVEGGFAVLEAEDGGMRNIPAALLPAKIREGDALILENGVWRADEEETRKRKNRIEEQMRGLFDDRDC